MTEKWNELIIKTEYEKWQDLENFLYSNDIYSFELIDPRMENIKNEEGRWDFIDEDIFKNQHEGITVKLYTSNDQTEIDLITLKKDIESQNLGKSEIYLIDDKDWKNNWKSFYETQEIGGKLVIKPTWEEYENKDNRHIIKLDPGMAFGTGGHETTRMCLEKLEKYIKINDTVLDIGCGSGILSIASKFLGAKKVIGTDLDPKAIEISKENAKLNDVSVDFLVSNLFENINESGNLIIANIIAEIVVLLIEDLDKYLFEDGYFICSGIISEKSHLVEDALELKGYKILEKSIDNEWVCIVARRNNA